MSITIYPPVVFLYPIYISIHVKHFSYTKMSLRPNFKVFETQLQLWRWRTNPCQLSSTSVGCLFQNVAQEPFNTPKAWKSFPFLVDFAHHLIFGSGTAEHWMDSVRSWPSSTSLFVRPFGKRGLSGSRNQQNLGKVSKTYKNLLPVPNHTKPKA
jgi:hypothetical protein